MSGCFQRLIAAATRFAHHRPFVVLFLLCLASNALGSAFNFVYNKILIIDALTAAQRDAFWHVVAPAYNLIAYPVCLGWIALLLIPLARCRSDLRARQPVAPARLEQCRQRLINLPLYQVGINFLGWLPGAILFPLGIGLLGGWDNALFIGGQFILSFLVTALLTITQTFFLLEAFLIRVVYPDFFQDARPAETLGTVRISLRGRLLLYWLAVAVSPLLAVLMIAVNATAAPGDRLDLLRAFALGVAAGGIACSGVISGIASRQFLHWVRHHAQATEQIGLGNFDHRIADKRPDEFGQLNDRFNDMAAALGRARQVRETFGQFVGPELLDELLESYPGLEGEVREVTVLFADIRGFSRRSAGESPERAVALLNQFLTLAVATIHEQGGWVNKFLGDGLMALFGAPRRCTDHADRAVRAALRLMMGLEKLNQLLAVQHQAPLAVGVGIHSGPALVGCVGAALTLPDGHPWVRREYTAIGETVNLARRLEQLTKICNCPMLISEITLAQLQHEYAITCQGAHQVTGLDAPLVVYRVDPD